MRVNATGLKNKLGEYLQACLKEKVVITKHGRDIAVLEGIGTIMKPESELEIQASIVKEEAAAYDYADTKHSLGRMTYEEFKKFTEGKEERYELIEGHVYLLASPRVYHQYALSKLSGTFFNWFKGKQCLPMFAPFDITLNLSRENPDVVQPDLMVICNLYTHINNDGYYMGVPSLVAEIMSNSTKRRDIITKLNLYMQAGIQEYWIVNCENKEITVYQFEDGNIKNNKTFLSGMHCGSFLFKGLEVKIDGLFL